MLRCLIPRRVRAAVGISVLLGRYPRTPLHRMWAYLCTGYMPHA